MKLVKAILVSILLISPLWAQHSVTLNCTDTATNVTFDFYRSTTSGGPYSQVNLSPTTTCTFTDTIVTAGKTYYYVAQAIDTSGTHSVNSNQVTVTIPPPPATPSLTATVK